DEEDLGLAEAAAITIVDFCVNARERALVSLRTGMRTISSLCSWDATLTKQPCSRQMALAMAEATRFLLGYQYVDGRPRSQRVLQQHAGPDDRAPAACSSARGMAQRARRDCNGPRLCHSLPAAVPRGSRPHLGFHAGPAGRDALATRGREPY